MNIEGRFSGRIACRTSRVSGRLSSANRRLNRFGTDGFGAPTDGEVERRSFSGFGFDPHSFPIALNHAGKWPDQSRCRYAFGHERAV